MRVLYIVSSKSRVTDLDSGASLLRCLDETVNDVIRGVFEVAAADCWKRNRQRAVFFRHLQARADH